MPRGQHPNFKRMRRLVDFIQDFTETHGYAPIIREMGEGIAKNGRPASTSLVRYYMDDLKERGILDFTPHAARTVRILPNIDLDEILSYPP